MPCPPRRALAWRTMLQNTLRPWLLRTRQALEAKPLLQSLLTALKFVLLAAVFMGGTGAVLWYFAEQQAQAQASGSQKLQLPSWGIVSDNPIRNKR